jgi:hypothetical protein
VDAAHRRTVFADGRCVAAAIDLAAVARVPEAVPVRGCLQAHGDHVVSPVKHALMATIVRNGLTRPGIAPVCNPLSCSGYASEKRRPERMHCAALRTTSSVRKFNVPISSSGPQRPQLRTRSATSRTAAG